MIQTCITISLILLTVSAWAQGPEIAGVWPAGGERGTEATVQVDGKNLQGVTALLSGRGIAVRSIEVDPGGSRATLNLAIAPDAPLGPREMRLGSSKGVSDPAYLWVDVFPEMRAIEPNDNMAHADSLDHTPVIINGRISAPTDRNVFSFKVNAGETWVFDCNAARIRSHLDPILELRNTGGHLLKMVQSTWESDPCLIYRFTASGVYYITVRDSQFLGGPDFVYRLTVGAIPFITGFEPRGEQAGKPICLSVEGVNLGETHEVRLGIFDSTSHDTRWIAPVTAMGSAPPIPLQTSELPIVTVSESQEPKSLPAFPCCMDGHFERFTRHRFRFRAGPQDHLVFDLLGRRIGSRIDGGLLITDDTGRGLASGSDLVEKDARVFFTPPKDQIYTIEVSNIEGKTGPDCFYRLVIRRIQPDFQVMLNDDRLQVGAGGTALLTVMAERHEGCNAPITISAEGLPAGVSCSGGTIWPDQNSVEITFTAPPGAALGMSQIHLFGMANIQGKQAIHEVTARESYMPRAIDPGMFQDDSYRRPYHTCEILPLGITPRAEPFALEIEPTSLTLAPGQKVEIPVRANRNPGANGEIKIELRNLPVKVKAEAPSIAAGKSETRIVLTAAPDAPPINRNVIILGHLDQATQPAPALLLTVKK